MRFSAADWVMLRFRPIAPKPDGRGLDYGAADLGRGALAGRRVKRKYVRVRGRQSKRSAKRRFSDGGNQPSPPETSGVEYALSPEKGAVTLQLLRDGSGSEEKRYGDGNGNGNGEGDRDIILDNRENWKVDVRGYKPEADYGGRAVGLEGGGSVIETWIVVECVTESFAGVRRLGFSDEEKMYQLEKDTCPGFVSDRTNNVIWVNQAYKKMVAEEKAAAVGGFVVWLVVKEELPQFCPSFACRVRVSQERGKGQKWNKIVPCDVWRMEFAGFAWKLDVTTALTLGC